MKVTIHEGLSQEFRTLLGNVVIEFADLESKLARGIEQLLGAPLIRGRIVTASMSFMEKHDAYRELALDVAAGDEALIKAIKALCKRIKQAGEDRNRYLHDLWISFQGSAVKVEWTKAGDVDITGVSDGELSRFIERMRITGRLLFDQRDRLAPPA